MARRTPNEPILDRPARLDKEQVVAVAARLAEEHGIAELTLSRVAEAVDRHVSSLYNHVNGVDDLRHEVAMSTVRDLSDVLWRSVLGKSREDALRSLVSAYRSFILDRPQGWKAVLMEGPSGADERRESVRAFEAIEAVMSSFGLDREQAEHAHRILSSALIGLVTRFEQRDPGDPPMDETYELLIEFLTTSLTRAGRRHS